MFLETLASSEISEVQIRCSIIIIHYNNYLVLTCFLCILNTVAAENLHPRDVPHLPGHEEGRQSITEPDQNKRNNSSAINADPKPKQPASQCTTLLHCIILSLCIYAVVQLLVLVSSVLDFLSS